MWRIGSLLRLSLYNCALGAAGAEGLGAALTTNGVLQELDVGANALGADGADALSTALAANRGLRTLGLDHNDIGVDGALSLAAAFAHAEPSSSLHERNSTLTALDLWANGVGDEGARALHAVLQRNGVLSRLVLSYLVVYINGSTGETVR